MREWATVMWHEAFGESGAADHSRLSEAWLQDRGRLVPLLMPKPDPSESTILGNVTYCVTSSRNGITGSERADPWRLVGAGGGGRGTDSAGTCGSVTGSSTGRRGRGVQLPPAGVWDSVAGTRSVRPPQSLALGWGVGLCPEGIAAGPRKYFSFGHDPSILCADESRLPDLPPVSCL